MATRQQLFEYIQRELNLLTQEQYTDKDVHIAYIYQAGFLQSVLADLCYNDTQAFNHFQRVVEKARSKRNKR